MAATLALDAVGLIAAARRRTGLSDLDDATLPSRLADLVAQLDERLAGAARDRAARATYRPAVPTARGGRRSPALLHRQERIEQPIIAFGEGRSGTTVLQMLLGCDPNSRLLEFWEAMRPSPPPGVSDTAERQRQS